MTLVGWFVRLLLRVWPWRGGLVVEAPSLDDGTFQAEPSRGRRYRRGLHIPDDAELLENWAVRRLAADLKAMNVARRSMVDWLSDVVYGFDGDFIAPDGSRIEAPDIEEEFPENEEWVEGEKPESYKWFSDFLRWADREPKQAMQKRVAGRIRLIKMALMVLDEDRKLGLDPDRHLQKILVRSAYLAELGSH